MKVTPYAARMSIAGCKDASHAEGQAQKNLDNVEHRWYYSLWARGKKLLVTRISIRCYPQLVHPRMTTREAISVAGIAGMAVAEAKPGTRRFYIFGGARCPA